MKYSTVIVAGLAGFIVYFLLGWLFYGVLFTNVYESNGENMMFITFGCLSYALFISALYVLYTSIASWGKGGALGAFIGFFYSVTMNFFMYSSIPFRLNAFLLDIGISIISTYLTGAVIGLVIGKMMKK